MSVNKNDTPKLKMQNGQIDRTALRASIKYLHFGVRLVRVREKKAMRSKAMADFLGLTLSEYRKFESGEKLPPLQVLIKMAKVLEFPLEKLKQWNDYAIHQASGHFEEKAIENGALKYAKQWEDATSAFKSSYFEEISSVDEDMKHINKMLETLKKDISRVVKLPVLPMQLFIILTVLDENKKVSHLHKIADFPMEGESFADYIARDPYWGPFTTYAANRIFFPDNPSKNINDCFNRLTMDQFKQLLLVSVANTGIYSYSNDLIALQQYHEFSSLGALMAQKLKPYLPQGVSTDHLVASCLVQGIGTHSFYTLLKPSLLKEHEEFFDEKKSSIYEELDNHILNLINYELHPVVGAMVAANWGCPEEVIQCLNDHHKPVFVDDHPNKDITPMNAILKIINFFVDADFPVINNDELTKLLDKHPQANLSAEGLFKVANEMNKLKDYLVEVSSSMIDTKSQQASQIYSKRIKEFKAKNNAHKLGQNVLELPKKSESRFDPEYQQVLINECHKILNKFYMEMLFMQKGEGFANYIKRIEDIQFAHCFVTDNNIDSLADKFKLAPYEVKKYLTRLKEN